MSRIFATQNISDKMKNVVLRLIKILRIIISKYIKCFKK